MAVFIDAPTNGTINETMNRNPDGSASTSGVGDVPAILSVTFILTVAMIAIIVTRIFIRIGGGIGSLRLVDWMNVLACFFSIAVSVALVIGVRYGIGRHKFDVTGPETVHGLKYYWISKILYILATWMVKMAVFSTLLAVPSAPPQQGRRYLGAMLYIAMIFMTSYTVVFWIGAVIECRPVSVIFDRKKGSQGQCLPPNLIKGMANAHAAMNTATDLFFVLLPIFMVVYGVRRSIREKVALGGVFVLAFFSVSAAAVHTLYEFGYGATGEVLFDNSNLAIWAIVEINTGLIAINLPALSPLFHKFLRPQRLPTRNSTTYSQPPATPTPSTLLAMTTVRQQTLERSESQRNIVDPHPTYPPPTRPAPPFATQSTQRFSSDSKSSLSEIMAIQVDVDLGQHPAFREREKTTEQTAAAGMGHKRMPTPMF